MDYMCATCKAKNGLVNAEPCLSCKLGPKHGTNWRPLIDWRARALAAEADADRLYRCLSLLNVGIHEDDPEALGYDDDLAAHTAALEARK